MKCHKCTNLVKDYNATKTDKTFLYECLKKNRWSVNTKDLKNGLGETKPYYCKGDYIWLDKNGNITSKSRQEFKNGDTHHYDRWIKEIKNYVDNDDFEYNEEFIIKLCLSYTLQSLRNGEDLKRFRWNIVNDNKPSDKTFEVLSGGFDEDGNPLYLIKNKDIGFEGVGDFEICKKMIEQQNIIEELKTYNLQHFLEWLVINEYVTDESMKNINNVINCVDKFKEYLNKVD